MKAGGAAVALAVVAGTLSFAAPAAAATQDAPAQAAAGGTVQASGGIDNFRVQASENGLFISGDPWCNGKYRSCNAWIEFPGYSQKNVNPRGGYTVNWPSAWAPGTTQTVSARFYVIDVFGNGWYGTNPLTVTATRPKPFTPLSASVWSVDQAGRTAVVTGRATDGAQIRLRGASVATSNGQWSATVGGLQVGRNDLTFEQWVDGSYRDARTVTVTIEAPMPGLTATGSFPDDTTQRARITGVAGKGATVVISSGGSEVARVPASTTDGSYVWDAPAPMAGGPRAYTVSQIVNEVASGNVPVVLDYGSAVTITSPADQSEAPAGQTTIRGNGEDGSSVTVALNGVDLPATTVANGTWSVVADLRRGQNTILATQRSKGANVTTSSIVVNPGSDEVPAPTAEVVFAADVSERARVEGTALDGATVTVRDEDDAVVGTPQVVDGEFSLAVDSPGAGKHSYFVTQQVDDVVSERTEAAGDFGAAVAVTPLPAQVVPGDRTISGTGEDGRTVTVQVGGQRGTATVADGTWSIDFELRPGTTPVQVQVEVSQTAQGNTITSGSTSTTPNLPIPPREVTIDEPSSHEYTPMASTTLSGTATPYAMVKIETTRGGLIRELQADKNGNWAFNRAYGPSNVYTFVATQTRVDGTTSRSAQFVMSPIGAFRALTVTSHTDGGTYTPGENTFRGTATPDAVIRIENQAGRVIASTQASPVSGAWAATGNLGPTADYTLTFAQTAPNGQQDELEIDLSADLPAYEDAALTSPSGDSTYRPGPVTFRGTGSEGTEIVAKNQWQTIIGRATVGASGEWAFERNLGPTADYVITFVATRGADTNTFTVELDSPKTAPLVITSPAEGETYTPGRQTTFRGTATPFAEIEVTTKRGGAVATATADDEGQWSFTRAFGPSNVYEMVFSQTDVYGEQQDGAEFDFAPSPSE